MKTKTGGSRDGAADSALPAICSDCQYTFKNALDTTCPECGTPRQASAEASVVARRQLGSGKVNTAFSNITRAHSASSSHFMRRSVTTLADLSGHLSSSQRKARVVAVTSSQLRHRLGAGVVEVVSIPRRNLRDAIQLDLKVPPEKRFCRNVECQKKNGAVALTKDKGFCTKCRTPYFNIPQYQPGELIGQYRILGPIAFGGFGAIYAAEDTNLDGRETVLKQMIGKDQKALAESARERSFLTRLSHENVMRVYNFVPSQDKRGNFIVSEWIGGQTLEQQLQARIEDPNVPDDKKMFSVAEGCSLMLGVLPGLAHVQEHGLVYCDFNARNCMRDGDRMVIIDLGGACPVDDTTSDITCTQFFDPPEIANRLSFACDTYSVGRTLLYITSRLFYEAAHPREGQPEDIALFNKYHHDIPTPDQEQLFQRYPMWHRFLVRATHEDPLVRFQNADEMERELYGVLRQVAAIDAGKGEQMNSQIFGADIHGPEYPLGPDQLPIMIVQRDSATKLVAQAIAIADPARRKLGLEDILRGKPDSREAKLRLAEVFAMQRDFKTCKTMLDELFKLDEYDYRVTWLRGKVALWEGDFEAAHRYFDACYTEMPGEIGPVLALAITCDMWSQKVSEKVIVDKREFHPKEAAIRMYDLISVVDPSFTTAAFNLAQLVAHEGRKLAIEALQRVPMTSIQSNKSLVLQVKALIETSREIPAMDDLNVACEIVEKLTITDREKHELKAEVFQAAIAMLDKGTARQSKSEKVLGIPLDKDELGFAACNELLECRHLTHDVHEREDYVMRAHQLRPWTPFWGNR